MYLEWYNEELKRRQAQLQTERLHKVDVQVDEKERKMRDRSKKILGIFVLLVI